MPAIRADLGLSYAELGLALSLPALVAAAVEPAFGVLGDTRHRRTVMLAGGVAFAAGLIGLGAAGAAAVFVVVMCVLYPASGAFVSLSQATLMDMRDGRRDLAMNRWVIAGGVGVLGGPALVAASIGAGLGWRAPFLVMAPAAAAPPGAFAGSRSGRRGAACGRMRVRRSACSPAGRSSAGSSCSSWPTSSST